MNTSTKKGYIAVPTLHETEAKTILRKHKRIESWFLSHYGMNLYRGCAHNCVYCDGRAERYYVDGDFGQDVTVKTNASEILNRELDPKRKRKPFPRSYMLIGGGVGDAYQPAERKYELTRKALELVEKWAFPVHILTKSILVERDLDILQRINEKEGAMISMSLSSADDKISAMLEPGCPPPSARLRTLRRFKEAGIATGVFLMPVVPFITDKPEIIEETFSKASAAGVDFVIFGGMTLKEGRQKEYFQDFLALHYPNLRVEYAHLYPGSQWGNAQAEYYSSLNAPLLHFARKYQLPLRIPERLWTHIVNEDDRIIVMLEHIDYMQKLTGGRSPYGYAAYTLSKLECPIREARGRLKSLKGVGAATERIILEILNTGTSRYYRSLVGMAAPGQVVGGI